MERSLPHSAGGSLADSLSDSMSSWDGFHTPREACGLTTNSTVKGLYTPWCTAAVTSTVCVTPCTVLPPPSPSPSAVKPSKAKSLVKSDENMLSTQSLLTVAACGAPTAVLRELPIATSRPSTVMHAQKLFSTTSTRVHQPKQEAVHCRSYLDGTPLL
jgi:hypothetical protein